MDLRQTIVRPEEDKECPLELKVLQDKQMGRSSNSKWDIDGEAPMKLKEMEDQYIRIEDMGLHTTSYTIEINMDLGNEVKVAEKDSNKKTSEGMES